MNAQILNQKKEENIVEYLLIIWQCEDLVRAFDFDDSALQEYLSSQLADVDSEVRASTLSWYSELVKQMKSQKIQKTGHVEEVGEIMTELFFLHNTLLSIIKDDYYIKQHEKAIPHLEEFKKKMGNPDKHPVEACLEALYGMLLLKIQKKEITDATKESIEIFAALMKYLAKQYGEMKRGLLDYSKN